MDQLGTSIPLSRPQSTSFSTRLRTITATTSHNSYPRLSPIWQFNPLVYRMSDANDNLGLLLQDVCRQRGWKRFGPQEEKAVGGHQLNWNLWWRFTPTPIHPTGKSLHPWQFTNHIPRAIGFCNKEYLARYIRYMVLQHGQIYDVVPQTYILPQDYAALVGQHEARKKLEFSNHENPAERAQNLVPVRNDKWTRSRSRRSRSQSQNPPGEDFTPIWILKPVGQSQGKGISVHDDPEDMDFMNEELQNSVAQEYISRPLLIHGFKFDLRLYVCVTSVSPLTVYMYREGLTRFATEKYDIEDLGNCFSHLTNSSVNKAGPGYEMDKEGVGKGCKWSLTQLRSHFKQAGINDRYLWQRIASIVILTLIGESYKWLSMPYTRNCFTFLGYDILIDEHLRPWLLEVNLCPGLTADCDVDNDVKKPMLNELFDLLRLPRNVEPAPGYSLVKPKYIPKYLPTPLPYINPVKVVQALDLIQPKNRGKFEKSPVLTNRLANLSVVYSKPLITNSMRPEMEKRRPSSRAGNSTVNSSNGTFSGAQKSTDQSQNGLAFRSWTDPPKKCGDWILVFPYDGESYEMSRNNKFEPLDDARLAQRMEHNLTNARILEYECREMRMPDSRFKEALKQINKMRTEVWMPPCARRRRREAADSARTPAPTANSNVVPDSLPPAEEAHANVESFNRPTIFTLDSAVSLATSFSDVSDEFSAEELLSNEIFGAESDIREERQAHHKRRPRSHPSHTEFSTQADENEIPDLREKESRTWVEINSAFPNDVSQAKSLPASPRIRDRALEHHLSSLDSSLNPSSAKSAPSEGTLDDLFHLLQPASLRDEITGAFDPERPLIEFSPNPSPNQSSSMFQVPEGEEEDTDKGKPTEKYAEVDENNNLPTQDSNQDSSTTRR